MAAHRISAGRRACRGGRFCVVALLVCLCWSGLARAADETVRVARVYDGDTCRLTDGRRLRLAGVDAPEIAHGAQPAQYYAGQSTAALAALVTDRAVRFVPMGRGVDRFGRLLGDLVLPDGASVRERLLAEGAVFVFWHRDLTPGETAPLLPLQRQAMRQGRGFWPRLLALPQPARPYVGNRASHRFHAPDCPEAGRISRRNRVALPDLAAAFEGGFSPARECTPWPTAPLKSDKP